MNKLLPVLLALTLLAVPFSSGCPGTPEKIELTYNNFFPPTHYHSILAEEFCKEIGKRTNGRVEITYYAAGGLAPAAETYDAVVEGICDIGMSCLAYTMGRFPASELVDIPHGYPNGWVASKVANDFYNNFKPAELADTHVLYFHAHGPGAILTTNEPVRTLEDLQGLVLRSTGVGAAIAEALGATGYAAAQGEAYELMQKGTIDGSVTPPEVLKGWKQAEVVKYVTNCYGVGYTTDMFVVMNLDKWNSLPSDIKKVFTEVSEEWIEKHAEVWVYYDKAGKDYFLTFEGREWIELSPDEMARWIDAAKSVKDNYMAEKGAMGLSVDNYESYLNQRVAYWSGMAPSEAECVSWVETELAPLVPSG
jgi:TRAP-type C4-dicarboxylate transport system substrate-binding protein